MDFKVDFKVDIKWDKVSVYFRELMVFRWTQEEGRGSMSQEQSRVVSAEV